MKIPSSVKVGGVVYNVKFVDHPIVIRGSECSGSIEYMTQTINIRTDGFSEQQQFSTFLHELVHAITHERMIEWGEMDEEYTESIAKALHAIIVDNNVTFGKAAAE